MRRYRALLAVKVDLEGALRGVQHEPTVLASFEMLAEIDDDWGRKRPFEIIANGANGGPASHRYVVPSRGQTSLAFEQASGLPIGQLMAKNSK